MKSSIGPSASLLSAMFFLVMIFLARPPLALAAGETSANGQSAGAPSPAAAMTNQTDSCRAVLAKLEEQDQKISGELRRIKRDIAALNQSIAEPGLRDAMAGIGYILGIFGVAAFMASRRTNRTAGK